MRQKIFKKGASLFLTACLVAAMCVTSGAAVEGPIPIVNDDQGLVTAALNGIDQQTFTNAQDTAKSTMNYLMYESVFAAIGGGVFTYDAATSTTVTVTDGPYKVEVPKTSPSRIYCDFVAKMIYGDSIGSFLNYSNFYPSYTAENIKAFLNTYAQAGEYVEVSAYNRDFVFVSADDNGFYALTYGPSSVPYIYLGYISYEYFAMMIGRGTLALYNIDKALSGESHIPGDVNGDGNVNNRDITALFQYLSGTNTAVVASALDIDGNGNVNNRDVTRLFQYLSGMDVTIN